jgi:hypothetical protein
MCLWIRDHGPRARYVTPPGEMGFVALSQRSNVAELQPRRGVLPARVVRSTPGPRRGNAPERTRLGKRRLAQPGLRCARRRPADRGRHEVWRGLRGPAERVSPRFRGPVPERGLPRREASAR